MLFKDYFGVSLCVLRKPYRIKFESEQVLQLPAHKVFVRVSKSVFF